MRDATPWGRVLEREKSGFPEQSGRDIRENPPRDFDSRSLWRRCIPHYSRNFSPFERFHVLRNLNQSVLSTVRRISLYGRPSRMHCFKDFHYIVAFFLNFFFPILSSTRVFPIDFLKWLDSFVNRHSVSRASSALTHFRAEKKRPGSSIASGEHPFVHDTSRSPDASRPHSFHEEKKRASSPLPRWKKRNKVNLQAAGNKRSTGCTELQQHLEIRFDLGRSPRVFALYRTRYESYSVAGIVKIFEKFLEKTQDISI